MSATQQAEGCYTVEKYLTRTDWLRARQSGCGCSDAASVVGLSTYQSSYGLWVDKTEPLTNDPMDELQQWGLLLEPVILSEFCRRAKVNAYRVPEYTIYRDRERPYLLDSPDAQTADGQPVQLKTAHFQAGKIWQKEVPIAHLCQCQAEIHVTGADFAYIAVLVDGYQFRWHKVQRHQKFIDRLLRRIDYFWSEYVIKRQPPPTDYSAATTQAILRKYPSSNGAVVELPDELEPLYDEMKQLTAAENAASKRKDEIRNHVRTFIGDARYGYLPNGKGFQWAGENGSRRFTLCERCPEPTGSIGNPSG